MKKKILSFALAVIMVMASFATGLSVFAANADYSEQDAQKAADGYVARVVDAGGTLKGYYKYFDNVYSDGYTDGEETALGVCEDGATVTLIADISLKAADSANKYDIAIAQNNLTIEGADGKNITVTKNGNFTVDGKTLTIRNLTYDLKNDGGSFAAAKNGGVVSFNGCTLKSSAVMANGYFYMGGNGTLNLTDCQVNITATSKNGNNASLVYGNGSENTVNFKNVTADMSAVTDYYGILLTTGGSITLTDTVLKTYRDAVMVKGSNALTLNIQGSTYEKGSEICSVGEGSYRGVTVNGTKDTVVNVSHKSTVTSEHCDAISLYNMKAPSDGKTAGVTVSGNAKLNGKGGYGLYMNTGSAEMNISIVDNASIEAAYTALAIAGVYSGNVNVTMNGKAILKGASRAINLSKCTKKVTVNMSGDSQMISECKNVEADKAYGFGMYFCGADGELEISMKDNAKMISSGDAIVLNNNQYQIKSASITLSGNATVDATKTAIVAGSTPVDLSLLEKSSLDAYTSFTLNDNCTLKVDPTASVGSNSGYYVPEMRNGAMLRVAGDDSYGLRFIADCVKSKNSVKYGMLIVKAESLENVSDFTIEALTEAEVDFRNVTVTNGINDNRDGTESISVAITNMKKENYGTEFAARAYALYTIGGVEVVMYSDFDVEKNTGSLEEASLEMLSDVKDTARGDYAHAVESYPTASEGEYVWQTTTKYSKLSADQYEAVKAYVVKEEAVA